MCPMCPFQNFLNGYAWPKVNFHSLNIFKEINILPFPKEKRFLTSFLPASFSKQKFDTQSKQTIFTYFTYQIGFISFEKRLYTLTV
jgi:hypothetical protein